MPSRRRIKRRQLKQRGELLPLPPQSVNQQENHEVTHSTPDFDSMHFDDGGDVQHSQPAPAPAPAPEATNDSPSPTTISYAVYKVVKAAGKGGATRPMVAEALRAQGVPYTRVSAALWDLEHRGRMRCDRNAEPVRFYSTIDDVQEAAMFRQTSAVAVAQPGDKPPEKGTNTASWHLYELLKANPGATAKSLARLLTKVDRRFKDVSVSAMLSRFHDRNLTRTEESHEGLRHYPTAPAYPAVRDRTYPAVRRNTPSAVARRESRREANRLYKRAQREREAQAAQKQVAAPTPAPEPVQAPVEAAAALPVASLPTITQVPPPAPIHAMTPETIVEAMSLPQARKVYLLLQQYFRGSSE